MTSVGADIRVRGVVHGVGYRYFCRQKAVPLGLVGWAKNNQDGSVSLHVEGERSAIESFLSELKIGPANASVTDLAVQWTSYSGEHDSFYITR
jgi:acylphosphatase